MPDDQAETQTEAEKKAPASAEKDAALSVDDLDKVSGGINPQPLPPMPRRDQ